MAFGRCTTHLNPPRLASLFIQSCAYQTSVTLPAKLPPFRSPKRIESCDSVIRVYDEAGNVIETHEHAGVIKEDFTSTPTAVYGTLVQFV
jgi:hypothetical protein